MKKTNMKLNQTKQLFLRRAIGNPLISLDTMTAKQIADFLGDSSLTVTLADKEVLEWFKDGATDKDKVRAGIELALDRLIKILAEDKTGPKEAVTSAAQVNAAKILLEMSGFAPPKQKVIEYADKEVASMDEDELKRYIAQKTGIMKKVN